MKVARLYTGDDGRSHFGEVELEVNPRGDSSESTGVLPAGGVVFNQYPPNYVQDWHTAPRRQYVVTLKGYAEIELGDGTKRRFGPGDVMLAEDLTGQGHITRVVGGGPRTTIFVAL